MRDDALPIRRIVFIGLGIAGGVAIAIGVVLGFLSHRHIPDGGDPVARPSQLGGGSPMLQTAPQLDLASYREEKSRALNRFGWTDAANGIVHVPIDLAMTMLVQRGAASDPDSGERRDAPSSPAAAGHATSMPWAASVASSSQREPASMGAASGAVR